MMTDQRYYSEKKISSSKSMRIFQHAMGITMMIMGGLGLFAYIGSPSDFTVVDLLLYVAIGIGGIVLFAFGKKRKKLIENCLQYVQYMEVQETIEISDLSMRMGKEEKIILKELGELYKERYLINMIIDYSANQIKMVIQTDENNVVVKQSEDVEYEKIGISNTPCGEQVDDEEVLRVQHDVNGDGKLKIYKEKVEYEHRQGKEEVTECYHYFNVISITADTFMKLNCLKIKLVDGTEVTCFLSARYPVEVYEELTALMSELKDNAPTMADMGITEEDAIKELIIDREKSKSTVIKIIGKFLCEYKDFKNLNVFNKMFHVAIPILCLSLLLCVFGVGRVSDQDYIGCAKTVVSNQLISPSTAMYYGEEVLDRDQYGRVLVRLCVEAQNGFGGYVKNTYVMVISDYSKITEEFITSGRVLSYSVSEEWLEDAFIEQAKSASNWGEPLSEDEKL